MAPPPSNNFTMNSLTELKDTIFVGGIPYDMTFEEFEEEVSTWGHVTKKYLKYHGGWGTVTFDSNSNRNRFLKDESRHRVGSKKVDVKPYIFNPDKAKSTGTAHLVIGKGQIKVTSESTLKAKEEEVKNQSIIDKQMSDLNQASAANNSNNHHSNEAQTGAVLKFVGELDGLIKTPKHGDVIFSIESVYLCKIHKFFCSDARCPQYQPLKNWNFSGSLHHVLQNLPLGTQVNFLYRSVSYKELPEFKHQATMVWPQASKKPANAVPVAADELNQTIIRFSVESSRSKSHSFLNNLLSKSSSPTPSQTSSSGNSIRLPSASNGPPGFSTAAQTPISNKFNYELPMDELLDDSGDDDLDSETEILIWIKDFLHNELGKSGVNVPMLLMNNIRSLGSDELVLQDIISFAKSKQIPIDNAKRDSLYIGLKKLRHKIRRLDNQDSFEDKKSNNFEEVQSRYLKDFKDSDVDFLYTMPLNQQYLAILDDFYTAFLKNENLDFKMDFDQAFRTLKPFLEDKTFLWILDWMSNDRRKRLRRNSDLKHFDDAEEILGAVEHYWHNLKMMKAKHLLLAFLSHDETNTIKMLLSYAKYQVYDLNKMTKVFKVLKDLNAQDKCPDEDFFSPKKDKIPFPHLNVDFQGQGAVEPSINSSLVKKHYQRFCTWLDMNIVLGGLLTFINDSPAQPNYEFQKLSIMHTWYKTSQTMDDLEHNLLKAGPNFKQILDHWTEAYLQNYEDLEIDPATVLRKTVDFFADKLEFSKIALSFAWSLSEEQGFVAQHYPSNLGLIINVEGEMVLFDRNVAFIQVKGQWCGIDSIKELPIGSYVKFRRTKSNVATKVWICEGYTTEEPLKAATKIQKGQKYYKSMEQNLSELSRTFPAFKATKGRKAIFRDVYFTRKSYSYIPDEERRISFELYSESKHLNGDNSEALDILASLGFSLSRLMALFMASKLLGFKGHEKLVDIIATAKVGFPDPMGFAMDLTAFFEDNCKIELISEESKCEGDVKKALKAVEQFLQQSGLYYESTNNGETNSRRYNPNNTMSGNSFKDSLMSKPVNGNMENNGIVVADMTKIDTLEREIKELTREVQRLSTMDDMPAFKSLQKDVLQLKKDSVNQQNILASHLKPVMDRLYTLSSDLDSLKNEIKAMKGLKLAPGSIGSKVVGKSAIYVRVALPQNRHEVHEFPTDENGNLSFTAVNAVYPGINALKFESKETKCTRLCRKIGDIFEPPEDGWGNQLYLAHSPLSQTTSNVSNMTGASGGGLSGTSGLSGHSGLSSGIYGQPLFPNYMTPSTSLANNLFSPPTTSLTGQLSTNNLFTQGSLFK